MMMGYPGAGKTTTAQMIAKLTGAAHISSDKMRQALFPKPEFTAEEHRILYEELDHITKELLKADKDVIYDANLNRLVHRQEKYDICNDVGAKSELIWVQTDRKLAERRATEQSASKKWRPFGKLDKATFNRLVDEIESPKGEEPHIIIYGSRFSEEAVKKVLDL